MPERREMARQLKIAKRAEANLQKIAAYISDNFGDARAERYLSEIVEQLGRIRDNPEYFPIEESLKGSPRKCVFKKKTIILFRFTFKTVTVSVIRDARSNWKR